MKKEVYFDGVQGVKAKVVHKAGGGAHLALVNLMKREEWED